jgi:hypothetical protein
MSAYEAQGLIEAVMWIAAAGPVAGVALVYWIFK